MSLDELLKDPGSSPAWRAQRKKLFRLLIGLTIAAAALLIGAVLVISSQRRARLPQTELAREQQDAKALAELMHLQNEAKELQQDLNQLRQTATLEKTSGRVAAPVAGPNRPAQAGSAPLITFEPGEGFATVAADNQDLYIPTGAVFQAQLITPIKTSVQRTFVMAETTHEFRMDMKRRIPRGSRLIGRSRLDPILKGVIVEFETLVLPNGIETSLSSLALSHNALPEIEGLYFSNDLQNYGTALAFGFLSGFADAARSREATIFGSQPEVSLNNQVLAGLSTASFQVAEEILRDIRTRSIEYVVVPAGERVFVALTRRYDIRQGRPR